MFSLFVGWSEGRSRAFFVFLVFSVLFKFFVVVVIDQERKNTDKSNISYKNINIVKA